MEKTTNNVPEPIINDPNASLIDKLNSVSGYSKRGSVTETNYTSDEWNNATSYINNIYGGDDINEIAAHSQNAWQTIRNSSAQLVTGTLAEIIKTPSYIEAMYNGFDEVEDNVFNKMGQWVQEQGEAFSPVYVSQENRDAVFNLSSEYIGDFIVNLGPTIAMMATAFTTSGATAGLVPGRLGKLLNLSAKAGKGGKYAKAAETLERFSKMNPEAFAKGVTQAQSALSLTRGVSAAAASRLTEAGMEGLETYKTVEAELRKADPNASDEDIKAKANAAAYNTWQKNMVLMALDFAQYNSLFKAFSKASSKGVMSKALPQLGVQMGSEALEEGFQFAVGKQSEALSKGEDTTVIDQFLSNMNDPQMQKAMVSGALGGAVFQGLGSLMNRKHNKVRETYQQLEEAETESEKNSVVASQTADLVNDPDVDTEELKTTAQGNLEKAIQSGNVEEQRAAQTIVDTINATEELNNDPSITKLEQEVAQIQKKIDRSYVNPELNKELTKKQTELDIVKERDNLRKKEIELANKKEINKGKVVQQETVKRRQELISQHNELIKKIKSEMPDDKTSQGKVLRSKISAIKASKKIEPQYKEELIKKYEKELKDLELENPTNIPTTEDIAIEKTSKELAEAEGEVLKAKDKLKKAKSKEGKKDVEEKIEKEEKSNKLTEDILAAENAKTPQELDKLDNKTIKENVKKKRIKDEIQYDINDDGKAVPVEIDYENATPQSLKEFYKDRPYTAFDDLGNTVENFSDSQLQEHIDSHKEAKDGVQNIQPEIDTSIPNEEDDTKEVEIEYEEPSNNIPGINTPVYVQFKIKNGRLVHINGKLPNSNTLDELKANYKIPTTLKENKVYDIKDKEGKLIPSKRVEEWDIDVDYIESGKITTDTEITLEVDMNNNTIGDWMSNDNMSESNFYIQAVVYDDTGRHVIGIVPDSDTNSSPYIKVLRAKLWKTYNASNKTGIVNLNNPIKLKEIYGGKYKNNITKFQDRLSPSAILKTGEELILAGANITQGIFSFQTNKDGLIIDYNEYNNKKQLKGKIFMVIKDLSGKYRAAHIFTKNIRKLPKVRDSLLKTLNARNVIEASQYVQKYIQKADGSPQLIPDFNDNLVFAYGQTVVFDKNKPKVTSEAGGIRNYLRDTFFKKHAIYLIPKDKAIYQQLMSDRNIAAYDEWYSNPDNYTILRVDSTDINKDGTSQMTFLDNEFNEVKTTNQSFDRLIKEANVYLHYAYNYYDRFKLGDKAVHIDFQQLNTGDYNSQIEEYLETDLEPKAVFHSPTFILNEAALEEKADIKEESKPAVRTAEPESQLKKKSISKTESKPTVDITESMLTEKEYYQNFGFNEKKVKNILKLKSTKPQNRYFVVGKYQGEWVAVIADSYREFAKNSSDTFLNNFDLQFADRGNIPKDYILTKPIKLQKEGDIFKVKERGILTDKNNISPSPIKNVQPDNTALDELLPETKSVVTPKKKLSFAEAAAKRKAQTFSVPNKQEYEKIIKTGFRDFNRSRIQKLVGKELKEGDIIETDYDNGKNRGSRTPIRFVVKNGIVESYDGITPNNDKRTFGNLKINPVNKAFSKRKTTNPTSFVNKEKAVKWFAKNLPQVSIEFVEAISEVFNNGGMQAQGLFREASVILSNTAEAGTQYHEAFHAVFRLMTTPTERKALLKAAERRYGVLSKDLLKDLKNTYPTLSDNEIKELALEEMLADEFKEYVLTEESKAPSRIKKFFQKLLNAIKEYFNYPVTIESYFHSINNGKFRDVQIVRDGNYSTSVYSKALPEFSFTEKVNAIDIVTGFMFDSIKQFAKLKEYSLDDKRLYKEILQDGGFDIFADVSNDYSTVNQFIDYFNANEEALQSKMEEFNKLYNVMLSEDGVGEIFPLVVKNLKRYGISVINNNDIHKISGQAFEDTDSQDEQELDEEKGLENWQFETGEINLWANSSIELRLITNTTPVVKWNSDKTDIEFVEGYLGKEKMYAPLEVYKRIQATLGNSGTIEQMKAKFVEAANHDPLFYYLYNEEKGTRDTFETLVWNNIAQNNKPRYLDIIQEGFEMKVIDANDASNSKVLQQQIINNLKTNTVLISNKGELLPNVAKEYMVKLDKAYKDNNVELISNLFQELGIPITLDELQSLNNIQVKSLYTDGTIKGLLNMISLGNDPIGLIDVDQDKQTDVRSIKNIATILDNVTSQTVSDSHRKPSGGNVYEWIQPNYMSKLVNTFKDKVFGKAKIDIMFNDQYYQNSPILNMLKDSYSGNSTFFKNFNMVIINTAKFQGKSKGVEYSNMNALELTKLNMALFHNGGNNKSFYIPTPVNSDSSANTAIELHTNKLYKTSIDNLVKLANQELYRVAKVETVKIKRREDNKDKFQYFPELNNVLELYKEVRGKEGKEKEELNLKIRKIVEKQVKQEIKEFKEYITEIGIVNEENAFTDKFLGSTNVDQFIQNYIPAHMAYSLDIGNILNGDLSYYKDVTDYYKRAKQTWSPGKYLDSSIVRPHYGIKIIPDNFVKDETKDGFLQNVEKHFGKEMADSYRQAEQETVKDKDGNEVKDSEGNKVKKDLGVNETDAQTLIDLYRFKEIYTGLKRWTPKLQDAYDQLILGRFNLSGIQEIFNVIKPFYYAHHNLNDGTIHPMQVKNSEAVILPFYGLETIEGKENPFYNHEYKKMLEQMGYEFNGEQVLFPYNDSNLRDPKVHADAFVFESAVKAGLHDLSSLENYSTGKLHQMNNEDYRLQMETPAHHVDFKGLLATQVRKHVVNNLNLEATYNVNGVEMTGAELQKQYEELIVTDIRESIAEHLEEFKADEKGTAFNKLIEKLKAEVISRDLGTQFEEALDYLSTAKNETVLPLYHPLHSYRIEALLTSLITNKVIKQKVTNSVVLANHTSFGFKTKPKVVFGDDGSIQHIEAYAPIYSEDLNQYMDDRGFIDIERIQNENPKLLEGVVYRIPNEDKYSTFPIKIIGFLPYEQGGSIVLPPEVTKIAGLDFDIDKVYGFFYNSNKKNQVISSTNTKKERDNLKLDYILGVWKHPHTAKQFLSGGNYDTLTEVSDKVKEKRGVTKEILSILSPLTWVKVANRMLTGKALIGIAANAAAGHAVLQHANNLVLPGSFRFNYKNYDTLNKTESITVDKLDKIKPGDQVMYIGEGGNYKNTMFEFIERIDNQRAKVKRDGGEIIILPPYDFAKPSIITKIAKNLAEYVAAFVDNGKDPRAESVNVNGYTVDVSVGMLMAGVDFRTVHYFLSQEPLIKFVTEYLNLGGNKQAEDTVKSKYGLSQFNPKKHEPANYTLEELENNVGKELNSKQLIMDFLYYKNISSPISDLLQAVKAGENGLGPTLDHTQFRINQVNNESIDEIEGAREYLENPSYMQSSINKVLEWGQRWIIDNAQMIDTTKGVYKRSQDFMERFKSSLLTVNEIRNINTNLFDYLLSGYTKPDSSLVAELPNRLKKYKDANKQSEYNSFLSKLFIEDNVIFYTGIGGQDNIEVDRIRETWELMLADPQTKDLALDLIRYSFYRSGYKVNSSSFSSLQPVHFYRLNKELIDYSKKQLQNLEHDHRYFVDQYIRHNFRTLGLPNLTLDNGGVMYNNVDALGKPTAKSKAYKLVMHNKANRTHLDRSGNVLEYVVHRPVLTDAKGNPVRSELQLFIYDRNASNEDYTVYRPSTPLGKYKTKGIGKGLVMEEYNYGVVAGTQFPANNVIELQALYNGSVTSGNEDFGQSDDTTTENNQPYYEGNIKPEPNTIFVFGSNPEGRHGAGAAKVAKDQFGAIYGQGEGLQGNAYALPTKDLRVKENKGLRSISREEIGKSIEKLYEVARQNPDKQFKVAYRNTTERSLNGYTGLEMIEMFKGASYDQRLDANEEVEEVFIIPSNVIFSKEWVDAGVLDNQTQPNTSVSLSTYTNHSGGAIGADTEWDIIGKEFGMINNKHYYFEGYKTPNGNTSIPISLKEQADIKLKEANKFLKRTFPTSKEYVNNLLRRNWWQVKNADAIFAVTTIKWDKDELNGLVEGGTAWAVYMGVSEGKPVYVFDQNTNNWFEWQYDAKDDTGWVLINTPTLTKNFAGIGTRKISKEGRQAIRDVYAKSSNNQTPLDKPC